MVASGSKTEVSKDEGDCCSLLLLLLLSSLTVFSNELLIITAEINTSVPAGLYLFPNPRQRFALRIWPGTIQVSRSR